MSREWGRHLQAIALVRPHFYNSFYRRVRVVRETPRPMPPAISVNVTNRCNLRCPFCIAADVLGREHIPTDVFKELTGAFSGLGRITLLGGEPLLHPDLAELLESARSAAAEVEVFTNGCFMGDQPDGITERIRQRFPGASADWLTLVLSVDPDHAGQLPAGRLAAAVDGLLAANEEGTCRARFSVTHRRLATGAYLDEDTVVRSIAEVSASLADWFMERLREGGVQDHFYFNSVICSTGDGGEAIRLEDLTDSPELAIGFGAAGGPRACTSLVAMWSAEAPGGTVLGDPLDEAFGAALGGLALEEEELPGLDWLAGGEAWPGLAGTPAWTAAWVAAREDPGAAARLLRARRPLLDMDAWDGGLETARRRAGRLGDFLDLGLAGQTVRFGEAEGDPMSVPVLAVLLQGWMEHPRRRERLLDGLVEELGRLLVGTPVYTGERELLGRRVPMAPDERRPLDRVHLPGEPGFGPRDELVLRPELRIRADGAPLLILPGLVPGDAGSPAQEKQAGQRLATMLVGLGLQTLLPPLRERLGPAGDGLRPAEGAAPLPAPFKPDDAEAAFDVCTWDRNRQGPDLDNPELAGLILELLARSRTFSRASAARLRSRLLTRLEQAGAPSPVAREMIRNDLPAGRDRARWRRYLDH